MLNFPLYCIAHSIFAVVLFLLLYYIYIYRYDVEYSTCIMKAEPSLRHVFIVCSIVFWTLICFCNHLQIPVDQQMSNPSIKVPCPTSGSRPITDLMYSSEGVEGDASTVLATLLTQSTSLQLWGGEYNSDRLFFCDMRLWHCTSVNYKISHHHRILALFTLFKFFGVIDILTYFFPMLH